MQGRDTILLQLDIATATCDAWNSSSHLATMRRESQRTNPIWQWWGAERGILPDTTESLSHPWNHLLLCLLLCDIINIFIA